MKGKKGRMIMKEEKKEKPVPATVTVSSTAPRHNNTTPKSLVASSL
jgi:hypothetical protein